MSRPPLPASAAVDCTRELLALAEALAGEQPACGVDPDLWFSADTGPAVATCRRCPATRQCLAYGMALHAESGVFGALVFTTPRRTA